jgi:hypothetical protein
MVLSGQPLRTTSDLALCARGEPTPLVVPQPELVTPESQIVEVTLWHDPWYEQLRAALAGVGRTQSGGR